MTTPRARLARVGRLEAASAEVSDWRRTAAQLDERGRALIEKAGDDLRGLTIEELEELELRLEALELRLRGGGA